MILSHPLPYQLMTHPPCLGATHTLRIAQILVHLQNLMTTMAPSLWPVGRQPGHLPSPMNPAPRQPFRGLQIRHLCPQFSLDIIYALLLILLLDFLWIFHYPRGPHFYNLGERPDDIYLTIHQNDLCPYLYMLFSHLS